MDTNGKFIRLCSLFVTSCDAYHLQSLHQHIQQGTLLTPQGMRAGLYTVVDLIRTEAHRSHSLCDKNIGSVVSNSVKLSAALGEQLPFHPRQCLSSKTGFLRVDTSPFPLGTSSQANKRKWKKHEKTVTLRMKSRNLPFLAACVLCKPKGFAS